MDYYESNRPPTDDSGLSGGVGFNFNGQIATQSYGGSYVGGAGGGGGGGAQTTVTLTICVDGVPKQINVYADGEPHDP